MGIYERPGWSHSSPIINQGQPIITDLVTEEIIIEEVVTEEPTAEKPTVEENAIKENI